VGAAEHCLEKAERRIPESLKNRRVRMPGRGEPLPMLAPQLSIPAAQALFLLPGISFLQLQKGLVVYHRSRFQSRALTIRCPTLYLPLSLRWNRAPDGHSRQGTLPGLWKLGFLCVTYSAASTHRRRRLESRSAQSPAALLGLTIKSRLNYNKRKKIIKLQKVICPPMLLTNLIQKKKSSILWYWIFGNFFRPKKCKTRLISLGKTHAKFGNFHNSIIQCKLNSTQRQWRRGDKGRNKESGSKSKPKEWNPKVHK